MMSLQQGLVDIAPDIDSQWWWDAVAEHRLVVPQCLACSRQFFPPQPTCPACGGSEYAATPVSGRGAIYSWVVVNRALHPAYADDVPYTILAVRLDGGVTMLGRLAPGSTPEANAPVEAFFYEVQGRTLIGFRPSD